MKRMNKYIALIALMISASFCYAQKDSSKREKFEALRSQILIKKLNLTETEQKTFLPMYKEYKDKERALQKRERKLIKASQAEAISKEEASKILLKLKKIKKAQANLFSIYTDKFLTVLSPEKVVKLYAVEREIRKIVAKKIRERKK